ncbi:hypothetical protein GWI33_015538 [Rhynchophorus ferrugineus]|uniref:IMD domain-containing protein n=1 Tax=Rhynchophorus ferrugineus TaxID=354439 RepID=A0A834M4E3_RHYFE|nr:hypothetical protein GWI33_015538 [Rhynchophorus ferrugineus]
MINAGKAYLKALHGAAAASRLYVDAISKLAKQAQQGTWGGSSDIGNLGTAICKQGHVHPSNPTHRTYSSFSLSSHHPGPVLSITYSLPRHVLKETKKNRRGPTTMEPGVCSEGVSAKEGGGFIGTCVER